MKKLDLLEEVAKVAKDGEEIPAVMSRLTMRAFQYYVEEYNKFARKVIGLSDNPIELNILMHSLIDKNNKELEKYGMKEKEDDGIKLDLI